MCCAQNDGRQCGKPAISGKIAFSSYVNGTWQIKALISTLSSQVQLTGVPHGAHYPALSLDGSKLAYAGNEGGIWVTELGGRPRKLAALPGNCTHPTWSPDGRTIAFVSYSFFKGKEDGSLWIAALNQDKVRQLPDQEGVQKYPVWSPDGSTLVYTTGYRVSASKIIEELWTATPGGAKRKALVSNDCSNIQPDWSPDGKRIAFASDRSGDMEIWVMDRDGTNAKNVTRHPAYDADPSWSPDGSRICFVSTRGGKMDIWFMDSDGGNQQQITGLSRFEAESKEPDWAP